MMSKSTQRAVPRRPQTVRARYLFHQRERQPRQGGVRFHAHPFWQVEIALSAGIEALSVGVSWRMAPGDVLIVPAHVPHGFVYSGTEGRWLSIKAAFDGRPNARAARLAVRQPALDSLRECMLALATEHGEMARHQRQALEHLLAALVTLEYPDAPPPTHSPLAAAVRAYVEREGGRAITVADVARHLGYSVSHVSARFRRESGEALKHFLDRRRAQAAARALEYSDLSIGEIAETLGFADVYTFSRFFKRLYGHSPRHYRQRLAARRHTPRKKHG
jgi:AraC-like DNA-binding protein